MAPRFAASPPAAQWWDGCAVAVVAALVYVNALANGFALDDIDIVARNPLAHSVAGALRAFAHTYWPEATRAGQYRPLTIASFAIDWSLFHGSTAWLHAMNVMWHVAACVLLWQFLTTLVSARGALIGATLFAVHPVHVEAVANLVGRSELMCATFIIAALLAHRHRHPSAVAFYMAALLSKESGITFLGLVALDAMFRRQSEAPSPRDAPVPPRGWRPSGTVLYAAYLAATALYVTVLMVLFRGTPLVRIASPWVRTSAPVRWMTAVSIVPQYVRLLLFPLHLHVDYMPRVIVLAHGVTPGVAAGAILLVAACVVAVRARTTAPPVALALALFAVTIAPVANIVFASGILLAERTLYLPSVSIAILAGWLWDQAMASLVRYGAPSATTALSGHATGGIVSSAGVARRRRYGVLGLTCTVILAGAVRTWTRTPIWRSTKATDVASLHDEPESYRAHERAADVLERAGDEAGAIREYAIARILYPDDPYLYQAAASMLVMHGDSGAAAAESLLDSARGIDPSPYADVMRHAWLRYAARDYRGTIDLARAAYLMQRDSIDAIMVLTQAAQQINDVHDARAAFRLALADHPENRSLHRSYATMLLSIGDSAAGTREGRLAEKRPF